VLKEYFDLDINLLQNVVKWSELFVNKALVIYTMYLPNDLRIPDAISAAIEFKKSGLRSNNLRKFAMDAYKASRETNIEQLRYAANSASLFAAIAYTHPFRDKNQAKHILGTIVNVAMALELENKDRKYSDNEIEEAIKQADIEIKNLLLEYPRQELGKNRINELFHKLDNGIRNKRF
jgi:hypothetical protein